MGLDGDLWLDELKEETRAEYSVYNGKTCYATTVIDKNGSRAVSMNMADKAAGAVIDKGEENNGEAELFGQNHYVAYHPLKDIDGKVVGALFSGVSSSETDKSAAQMILVLSITALGVHCGKHIREIIRGNRNGILRIEAPAVYNVVDRIVVSVTCSLSHL